MAGASTYLSDELIRVRVQRFYHRIKAFNADDCVLDKF